MGGGVGSCRAHLGPNSLPPSGSLSSPSHIYFVPYPLSLYRARGNPLWGLNDNTGVLLGSSSSCCTPSAGAAAGCGRGAMGVGYGCSGEIEPPCGCPAAGGIKTAVCYFVVGIAIMAVHVGERGTHRICPAHKKVSGCPTRGVIGNPGNSPNPQCSCGPFRL